MILNTLYCNGSSLSAGGGLYEQGVKNKYKELYNLEWSNEKDVTYAKYIADHFNLNLIHDAQSGSGAPRLIRRTYEYIERVGLENAKKTLFLFEITDPIHRVDMFNSQIDDYMILNVRYSDDNDGTIYEVSPHHKISPTDTEYPNEFFKGKIQDDMKYFLENYHSPFAYTNKFKGDLIGLFSFLEQNNMTYFYMFDTQTLRGGVYEEIYKKLDGERKLIIEPGVDNTSHFCHKHNVTIMHDLNGFTSDTHPGYYGYKMFSEVAIKFLESRLQ